MGLAHCSFLLPCVHISGPAECWAAILSKAPSRSSAVSVRLAKVPGNYSADARLGPQSIEESDGQSRPVDIESLQVN